MGASVPTRTAIVAGSKNTAAHRRTLPSRRNSCGDLRLRVPRWYAYAYNDEEEDITISISFVNTSTSFHALQESGTRMLLHIGGSSTTSQEDDLRLRVLRWYANAYSGNEEVCKHFNFFWLIHPTREQECCCTSGDPPPLHKSWGDLRLRVLRWYANAYNGVEEDRNMQEEFWELAL
ncbi:uncharacterized protein L3040_008489 [Drepanopeziza brunnea f. sp. 'multigermtubi']|uniref:uncharacterized protein n=1 Tax=Drepanopeziza brunnea f. sp. 'multigermtubi' TaxID=698441 RepID=UPI002390BFA0|nr:hypothetical protein L3040_008489 [Drepanopeziza brunnea f. sp. 'multigermtubi']